MRNESSSLRSRGRGGQRSEVTQSSNGMNGDRPALSTPPPSPPPMSPVIIQVQTETHRCPPRGDAFISTVS